VKKGAMQGPLAKEEGLYFNICAGARVPNYAIDNGAGLPN